VRTVVELVVLFRDEEEYANIRETLRNHGLDVPDWTADLRPKGTVAVHLEKSDARRDALARDMERIGHRMLTPVLVPAFEPWELEQAEFVLMRVFSFCGRPFGYWEETLGLPEGTRVLDKRGMGRQDVATTYAWNEFVISERLREMLTVEGLQGWAAEPIRHTHPERDHLPPLYEFQAASVLPPLAPETEVELRKYEDPAKTGVAQYDFDYSHLYGTTALFKQGPLCYRRQDIVRAADVNRTHEVFGEGIGAPSYFVLSRRAYQAFLRHRVRGDVKWEPVVILE
jgi:hypothetical protein